MHGVITAIRTPIKILVGPIDAALRYAASKNLNLGDFEVVTCADELHAIDPPSIERIVLCRLDTLGSAVVDEIREEVASIKRLWREIRVETATP